MKEYFEAIQNISPDKDAMSFALVEGNEAGERALFSGQEPVFLSHQEGFLAGHKRELSGIAKTGLYEIDGVQVYAEHITGGSRMIVCGAGHVALPVIRIAKMIGMRVSVLDDRADFVDNAVQAGADVGISGLFEDTLPGVKGSPDTYFVIVTRGHQFDKECLREILKKPHAYIGLMGSRRRTEMAKQNMIDEGFSRKLVESIHTPIGLSIGAKTPEEIAVSILAEVISVRSKRPSSTFPEDVLKGALSGERGILATIIQRGGSAPREVGAKMLIQNGGRTIGTIGGGLLEHRTILEAQEMLKEENPAPRIFHSDLTATDAAKEGEVCGGTLDVFLEEI